MKALIFVLLFAVATACNAQSYHAEKMRKPKRLHAKQHGVKVLITPIKQKIQYARKRRKAIKA